jgi:DNA processing protein
MRFIEKFGVRVFCYGKSDYPTRLLHCEDAPALIYFKGDIDLNAARMISVVGTRMPSDYGKQCTKMLIEQLAEFHPVIVSGLAYGIDTLAHRFALKSQLPTIGILAHGLDRIYPPENKLMAREMIQVGGLLTEFMSDTQPDACNFPMRNRIVAGLVDAVVVIESGIKGGSMITADIANSYNKDVFALPGRINDEKSLGCNLLIRENKASIFSCGADIAAALNWDIKPTPFIKRQPELFPDLSGEEKTVMDILTPGNPWHIDALLSVTGFKSSRLAASLLKLEMLGLVKQQPGRFYSV